MSEQRRGAPTAATIPGSGSKPTTGKRRPQAKMSCATTIGAPSRSSAAVPAKGWVKPGSTSASIRRWSRMAQPTPDVVVAGVVAGGDDEHVLAALACRLGDAVSDLSAEVEPARLEGGAYREAQHPGLPAMQGTGDVVGGVAHGLGRRQPHAAPGDLGDRVASRAARSTFDTVVCEMPRRLAMSTMVTATRPSLALEVAWGSRHAVPAMARPFRIRIAATVRGYTVRTLPCSRSRVRDSSPAPLEVEKSALSLGFSRLSLPPGATWELRSAPIGDPVRPSVAKCGCPRTGRKLDGTLKSSISRISAVVSPSSGSMVFRRTVAMNTLAIVTGIFFACPRDSSPISLRPASLVPIAVPAPLQWLPTWLQHHRIQPHRSLAIT